MAYYSDNEQMIRNIEAAESSIQNQRKTDKEADQLSLFDPRDLFTGSK